VEGDLSATTPILPRVFARYVAVGDSSTEGLDDPDGRGGFRGWADRLAGSVAAAQGSLLYANLAVRGLRTRRILDTQLEPALALRPDLATVFAGTNDVVARRFDAAAFAADVERMQRALVAGGATVLSFTLPELGRVMPLGGWLTPRVRALNDALRAASAGSGAILVDFAAHAVAEDRRLWSADRLHANAAGHARIAAALAHALNLPGSDDSWAWPLPPAPRRRADERFAAEMAWARRHLLPWLWRHARGLSSGDGLVPKRPRLEPVFTAAGGDPRRAPAGPS
jgi:lysophospholipase L1-like esterase